MKKYFCLILCILISLSSFIVFAEDKIDIFVKDGCMNGDGSFENPFGTFLESQEKIRVLKSQNQYPKNGITVYFREGKYSLKEEIKLDSRDSGEIAAPVVYRAYQNEQVDFIGGISINIKDMQSVTDPMILKRVDIAAKNNLKQIDLKTMGISSIGELPMYGHAAGYYDNLGIKRVKTPAPELFFDNEIMTLSRWPNEGYTKIGKVITEGSVIRSWCDDKIGTPEYIPKEQRENPILGATFEISKERASRWATATDPWVFGYFRWDWADLAIGISKIDAENSTVTTNGSTVYGCIENQNAYFYNMLEEIDVPKEWYIDKESNILYFYPPKDEGELLLSVSEKSLIHLDNVKNVEFKGLSLKCSRDNGIMIENSENIKIELCSISKTGKMGVNMVNGKNCGVISCHIYDNGSGGIALNGGDYTTLEPCKNYAENNLIHNFARIEKTYRPAIEMNGVGMRATHNKIYDGVHMAIFFGGNDNIIEYNDISNVLTETADMGAIYAGRCKTFRGNIIRNNYIHDIFSKSTGSGGVYGVYLDDIFDGTLIENNTFSNLNGGCVFINGGRDNIVRNNIMANVYAGVRFTGVGIASNYIANVKATFESNGYGLKTYPYKSKAYAKYEHLANVLEDDFSAPKYNVIKNNVCYNAQREIWFSDYSGYTEDYIRSLNDFSESYMTDTDPGFVNLEKGNFAVKKDSSIYKVFPDFKEPDFYNMGMYTPMLKNKLKGSISLLIDSPLVYNDFHLGYIDEKNMLVTLKILDNKTYVPLRFIAESLDGEVIYDEKENTSLINVSESTLKIDLNTKEMFLNGEIVDSKDEYSIFDGRIFVPLRLISESLNKNVQWFDCGIIIISDKVETIPKDNVNLISELYRRLK